MSEYTVTEALVKLKQATKKIEDATKYTFVGQVATKAASVAPAGFKSVDEFKQEVKRRLDSVNGLITFRDKLKKAIVESNARTNVVVGSATMSVAEAIETKHSITAKKALLVKLVTDWQALERDVNAKNSNVEARADQYVTTLFSQNPAAGEEEKSRARTQFISNNTAIIVTHDNVRNVIEGLKTDIENFEANVDVALSVVNATTKVALSD